MFFTREAGIRARTNPSEIRNLTRGNSFLSDESFLLFRQPDDY
jgi:hypothetical protein